MVEQISQIEQLLKQYKKIFILRHKRPDPDAIGSQLGLYYILKEAYPNTEIYAYGTDDIEEFLYLGKNDNKLENNMKNSLIFIMDTANVDRIEGDNKNLRDLSNTIVKIDHHPNLEPYGKINIVNDKISSTSELVYEVFVEKLKLKLNSASAKCLYAGIYTDTGGFSYSNTTSKTFSVVSELVKYDFEFESLMLNLKELEEDSIRILGYMYENVQINNGLGLLKFDKKLLKEKTFDNKKISMLVNYLGVFKNLKAWVLFVEHDNFIRVNLRSKRDINVSKIANKYNGGGHMNASGAKVFSWEESQKLLDELKQVVK